MKPLPFSMYYTLERENLEGEDGEWFDLLIEYDITPAVPARISGPPEDCYPEEGAELREFRILLDEETFTVTAAEREEIMSYVEENHVDEDPREYEPECEYD